MDLAIDTGKMSNYTIPKICEYVRTAVDELMKLNLFELGISSIELERRQNKKARLQAALNDCIYGSRTDKEFVKEFIRELLLQNYDITPVKINGIIPFDRPEHLSIQDRFDILLHVFKKEHGYGALAALIKKYGLDELRKSGDMEYFFIDADDIDLIYKREAPELTFDDKYDIVVQRVYSLYKGYNAVDDIMDMQVDGISCGVNGYPETFSMEQKSDYGTASGSRLARSYESIWLYFQGKSIHMKFLSLGSYEELQRVCRNVYKYGYPGQLSKMDGYKVNKLKDGSRVVVLRPDFCETWCFFIRKFELPDISLPGLIKDRNCELVIELIKYLVKGSMNTSVTGAQGSGKTTLLRAMIEHIYAPYTLRILEMAFELHVRKSYPDRNIVTLQETDAISGQTGLDVLKKTDGVVTIVGEVATDPVAAYMIQTAQVASLFTLFSHHAKKFPDLVMSLRNSLLKTGVFSNERIAEEQIIRVLNFDIHLEKDLSGKRYVERITECIPLEEGYTASVPGGRGYAYKNIIEFDYGEKTYIVKNRISDENIKAMMKAMLPEDRKAFGAFLDREFGEVSRT